MITREIEIECLPDEIPESFTVDVTELMIGQSIRASEIPLAGSMKLLSPADRVISHVVTLKAEEAEPAAAEAQPRQPPSPKSSRRARRKRKAQADEEEERRRSSTGGRTMFVA